MIYLMILLIGITTLIVSIQSWFKIKRSVRQNRERKPLYQSISIKWLSHLFLEWLHYVQGEKNKKQLHSLIFSLLFLVTVILINKYLLQFNWIIVLFASLVIMFFGQLKLGRLRYDKIFEESFPVVLSTVSAAVTSGASIHQALGHCGRDITGPLGHEFNRISRRLNLGEAPEAVFNDAYRRFRYPEFYSFTIVILTSMQHGGQLKVLMKRLGRVVAANKAMDRRKAAMTSESRMSAKIISVIPLLFLGGMKYSNPEGLDFLLTDNQGRLVLYYVLASEILGLLIIWGLIKRTT